MENQIKQSDAIQTSMHQVAKVLLEVLIVGEEKDKDKLNQFMEDIQEQIKLSKNSRKVRLLFYIDKGEKTLEEKTEWLINNSVCVFHVLINPKEEPFKGFVVPKDFIKNCVKNINSFQTAFTKMKSLGVQIKKTNKNGTKI